MDPSATAGDLAPAFAAAFAEIARIHHLMSWHAADSDVTRINRAPAGHWICVDPHTEAVLQTARMLWVRTDGLFDVTCERHLRRLGVLPGAQTFASADRPGGMADLELDGQGRVRLQRPLSLNLDGIAKGYAVDRAIESLQSRGIAAGCVNAGGDLRLFGAAPQAVSVRDPRQPARLWRLGMHREIAIATTGSYFLDTAKGVPSAIIHPVSGQAVPLPGSITVTAPYCVHADALTKVAALNCASDSDLSALLDALGATVYLFPPAPEEIPDGFQTARQ